MTWLDELKAGDEVVVSGTWRERIARVERVTPKFIYADGDRFRKSTRYKVGGHGWLEKPTEDRRLEINLSKLRSHIASSESFRTASKDKLQRIVEILEEPCQN